MAENNTHSEKKAHILDLDLDAITIDQALNRIDDAIASRTPLNIGVVNAAKIVNMGKDALLQKDVKGSDMILADGMSVVWASKILGQPLPERVAGIDLMHGILRRGSEKGYRVFCLGATEEICQIVIAKIKEMYPGVVIAGSRNGYYGDSDEEQIAENIRDSKADVLFVAITSPKKENFMAKWNKTMNVPVVHGVGGSFDVLAGKVKRAPELWQKLGIEWLYRVLQEPGRLWKRYLITNLEFVKLVFRARFSKS